LFSGLHVAAQTQEAQHRKTILPGAEQAGNRNTAQNRQQKKT